MKDKFKNMKNKGIKIGERPTDYRAGAKVGTLPYFVATDNWDSYLPPEEKQFNDDGDSMACVTFAELNGIETQEKFQTGNYVEYSDRWIAKIGGTTREGAYLWQIADAIRKYGLGKEESYPVPEEKWNWNKYHEEIPQYKMDYLLAEGQGWLKKWDIKYESIDVSRSSLMKHIKMAPLIAIVPGHAVLNFRNEQDISHIFDTYPPHKKTVPSEYYPYKISHAMKIVLYKKEQALDPDTLLVNLKYGDSGSQVLRLKRA